MREAARLCEFAPVVCHGHVGATVFGLTQLQAAVGLQDIALPGGPFKLDSNSRVLAALPKGPRRGSKWGNFRQWAGYGNNFSESVLCGHALVPGLQPGYKFAGGHGPADVVTLGIIAIQLVQLVQDRLVFHAFCYNRQAKVVG